MHLYDFLCKFKDQYSLSVSSFLISMFGEDGYDMADSGHYLQCSLDEIMISVKER